VRRAIAAALHACLLSFGAARAESLVSTLSDNDVEITSNFTGEQIVVFGAVIGAPAGDPGYEAAVVVEGPDHEIVVRRKSRLLGIWANRASRRFERVPSFYAANFSRDFPTTLDPAVMEGHRLGIRSLPFVVTSAPDGVAKLFAEAFIDLKSEHALYAEKPDAVQFLAPNVFRTTFFLPSDVPTGDYKVSAYLFRDGAFLAEETQRLTVEKGGFSERIAAYADERPLAYGLASVALALFTGWFAGVIFKRP